MRIATILLIAALGAMSAAAAPVFETAITVGVTTGGLSYLYTSPTATTYQDGSPYTGLFVSTPAEFLVSTRPYSSQLVTLNSTESSESFATVGGNRQLGFASAVSTADLAPQAGVVNGLRFPAFQVAFSRYYATVKNNSEEPLDYELVFEILPGELTLRGTRNADNNAHMRAETFIDYRLLTPNGGAYDETTGRLFDYFADVDFDGNPTSSNNAALRLVIKDELQITYTTSGLLRHLDLPTIPGFGELTVYYDMYASLNVVRHELGGTVRLGDPGSLTPAGGGFLALREAAETPEPATFTLIGAGLVGVFTLRRRLGWPASRHGGGKSR